MGSAGSQPLRRRYGVALAARLPSPWRRTQTVATGEAAEARLLATSSVLVAFVVELLRTWPGRRIDVVDLQFSDLTIRYQPGFGAMPARLVYSARGCGALQVMRLDEGWSYGGDVEGEEARCAWRALRACCGVPGSARLYAASLAGAATAAYEVTTIAIELCIAREK